MHIVIYRERYKSHCNRVFDVLKAEGLHPYISKSTTGAWEVTVPEAEKQSAIDIVWGAPELKEVK